MSNIIPLLPKKVKFEVKYSKLKFCVIIIYNKMEIFRVKLG